MIDTSIRFNDHNSYKVTSILMGYPFGVEGMDYITHSFQAYATTALASATRARTKFFDADGATISDVSHAFAVTTVFGKVEIPVAVPATAVQAQLVLLHGGTDWWLAEPKSEQGEISTPYNVNYQGQMTYITPNGIYTGMLTANQIVVAGTASNPDENLGERLVTISNGMINLTSAVQSVEGISGEVESRITTIEAGQITLSSRVGTVEPKVTKITSSGIYTGDIVATQITSGTINANRIAVKSITGEKLADGTVSDIKIKTGISATKVTTGTLDASKVNVTNLNASNITTGSISGEKLSNGTVSDIKISSLNGSKITANSITADKINVTNLYVDTVRGISDSGRYAKFFADGDESSMAFYSTMSGGTPRLRGRVFMAGTGMFGILGTPRSGSSPNYVGTELVTIAHGDASYTAWHGAYSEISYGNKRLGVDSTGPYYVKSGSKTYL